MSAPAHPDYEIVIGLEVHCQLRTRSKLFSASAVGYGEPPNHLTSPVCLGLPGALPVLNRHAVELAIRAALATHCEVHPLSLFARKNYFYPDLPKGYQISQYEEPLATGGWLDIELESGNGEVAKRRIGLTRIHMEEDAGKLLHDDSQTESHVDLNRAGVPLIEIVSEPDLRSAEEAGAYLRKLRAILRTVEASDADMEKGQFRCDANVSLRPHGETRLGTRTELKNLNSFRFVEAGIRAEVERQAELLDRGERVRQVTFGFDADRDRLFVMREKENADDYRYFPDPDLIPLQLSEEQIDEIRAALPELPDERAARFESEHGIGAREASVLVQSRALADFYEAAAAAHGTPELVAKWVLRDVLKVLREREAEIAAVGLAPASLAALIALADAGRITAKSARDLLAEILLTGGDPEALVRERGLEAVSDEGEVRAFVEEVLAANPKAVESYRAGDQKAVNFLMGQVMKRSRGQADPGTVRELLIRELEG